MPSVPAYEPESPLTEGLRQRRNRETRQRIHMTALELGEARGVASVTVAEIAEAAGISRRTFFRYFKNKEEAVLSGHSRYIEAASKLPLAIRHRAEAFGAIERIGDIVLEQEGTPDLREHRRINWLVNHDPAIRAYAVAQDRVVADLFRDRLSVALPDEPLTSLELIADLAVTVWRHGWVRWSTQANAAGTETPEESHHAVRELFREVAATA